MVLIQSRNMLGAWKRGWNDCIRGLGLMDNPYELKPNPRSDSMYTFSKGFWAYWIHGWTRARSHKDGCAEYPIECPCVYWEWNERWRKVVDKNCKWCSGNGYLD